MKKLLFSTMLFLLYACGGGNETQTTSTPVAVKAVKLSDISATENANFNQFKPYEISIDLSHYSFTSEQVFIKVYVSDEKVLYLGKAPKNNLFKIHIPNNVTRIKYDIFSASSDDEQVTEELIL